MARKRAGGGQARTGAKMGKAGAGAGPSRSAEFRIFVQLSGTATSKAVRLARRGRRV